MAQLDPFGTLAQVNAPAGPPPPPGSTWETMTEAQRRQYMNNVEATQTGKPVYPTIDSLIQGSAGNPFLSQNLTYNPNYSQGYEGLRSLATAKPGQGTWEQYMLQNQALEQSGARDEGARQAASARALGFSDLARRGGISSGAASRLARGGQGDLMNFLQQNQRAGEQARLGIGTQAEQNRIGTLGKVADMETQGQQFNIKNIMTQKALEDAAKLGKYGEEMRAYGANKTADATANAGGGTFYFCRETMKVRPFSDEEMGHLLAFKEYGMKHAREKAIDYFANAQALVKRMNAAGFDWHEMIPFTNAILSLSINNGMHEAVVLYWETYQHYMRLYPEIKEALDEKVSMAS